MRDRIPRWMILGAVRQEGRGGNRPPHPADYGGSNRISRRFRPRFRARGRVPGAPARAPFVERSRLSGRTRLRIRRRILTSARIAHWSLPDMRHPARLTLLLASASLLAACAPSAVAALSAAAHIDDGAGGITQASLAFD